MRILLAALATIIAMDSFAQPDCDRNDPSTRCIDGMPYVRTVDNGDIVNAGNLAGAAEVAHDAAGNAYPASQQAVQVAAGQADLSYAPYPQARSIVRDADGARTCVRSGASVRCERVKP